MTQKPAKPAARAKREAAASTAEATKPATPAKRGTAAPAAEPIKPATRAKRATPARAAQPGKPARRAKREVATTAIEPADRRDRAAAVARAEPAAGRSDPSAAPASRRSPSYDEISQRAYFMALEQGGGDEVANWLRAERELTTA
jgi:Protein of unknown function (DUF2934)